MARTRIKAKACTGGKPPRNASGIPVNQTQPEQGMELDKAIVSEADVVSQLCSRLRKLLMSL
jgi:hypothetical protein